MGMRIAVISDSHDNVENLKKAVVCANERNCEHLFHLGDIVSPLAAGVLKGFNGKINAVFGNCDGDKIGLMRVISDLGGDINTSPVKINLEQKLFVLMHAPVLIDQLAGSVDYILYGHLHKHEISEKNNTVIINPGETAGLSEEPGMVFLDLSTGDIETIKLL